MGRFLSFRVRVSEGRSGKSEAGLAVAGARGGRTFGPTALQSFNLASRRTTCCVRCALFTQTRSTVQWAKRVGTRADARSSLFRRHLLNARTGQASLGFVVAAMCLGKWKANRGADKAVPKWTLG